MESRATAVPIEDAELLLQTQEPAVPPALVQERETGPPLNDEKRWQALGGRLHQDMLIPGNTRHPDLRQLTPLEDTTGAPRCARHRGQGTVPAARTLV